MKPYLKILVALVVWTLLCWFGVLSVSGNEVSECKRLAKKYKAQVEVRVEDAPGDGVRIDLMNDQYVYEADWNNHKVYEAFGQAALYAALTGKKPAVIILIPKGQEKAERERWLRRASIISKQLHIPIFPEQATE